MKEATIRRMGWLEDHQIDALLGLVNGRTNPTTFSDAAAYVRRCYHAPDEDLVRLVAANQALGLHGIEGWPLGLHSGVSYCNTGDSYAPTLALTPEGFEVASLADLATRYSPGAG